MQFGIQQEQVSPKHNRGSNECPYPKCGATYYCRRKCPIWHYLWIYYIQIPETDHQLYEVQIKERIKEKDKEIFGSIDYQEPSVERNKNILFFGEKGGIFKNPLYFEEQVDEYIQYQEIGQQIECKENLDFPCLSYYEMFQEMTVQLEDNDVVDPDSYDKSVPTLHACLLMIMRKQALLWQTRFKRLCKFMIRSSQNLGVS